MMYQNGDLYEGNFDAGLKSGQGKYRYGSEAIFTGGEDVQPREEVYQGQWENDEKNGIGTMLYRN